MDTEQTCPACRRPLPANAPQGLCPECLIKGGLPSGEEIGPATSDAESAGAADRPFTPPTVEELAGSFPQLEVLEFIGQGGMGAVYKARQKQLDRVVALKILPPGIGDDPAFAERFAREAKAMAKLNHPGIVTIHDFGQTDGLFYFLMEFVDGVTLWQLQNTAQVSPREALAIVPQICDALQYAHDMGIVHRDIKPENILLDRLGRVKVADFGLAKLVGINPEPVAQGGPAADSRLTEAGKVMGTPQYMAPEQRERPQEVDHRADIYSLGVVFYQLLTGELPLGRFVPPSRKVEIDVRLDEVVLRALEKEPQRRYQQAGEIKTQVETIATTPPEDRLPPASDATAVEPARLQVRGPAIGLLLTGMLNCLTIPMTILWWNMAGEIHTKTYVAPSHLALTLGLAALLAVLLVSLTPGIFTIFAALKMNRLQAYGPALAASILAILISPISCLIGLPIGIWALIVLCQREVRAAFARHHKRTIAAAGSTPPRSARRILCVVVGLFGVALLACLGINNFAPYLHGRSRAQNDLEYQSWVFAEGRGYYPASTFSDGVAYLYSGYPQDDWADGTRLSKRYVDRWTTGYRAVVENAGYTLRRTNTKPALLPNPAADKADPSAHRVEKYADGLPNIDRLGSNTEVGVDLVEHPVGPWNARLPNGVTVELIGVAENPSTDRPWWQPDGSWLAWRPYRRLGTSVEVSENEIAREFAVRLSNTPSEPVGVQWKIDPCSASALGNPLVRTGNVQGMHGVAVRMPASQQAANVHIGVAAGAWQTAAESGAYGRDVIGGKESVVFSPTEEKDGSITITVAHDMIDAEGEGPEVRVIAVEFNGVEHSWASIEHGRAGKFSQRKVTFSKVSLQYVKTFRLQTRPYQWAEFRNVLLQATSNTTTQTTVSPDNPTAGSTLP